MSVISIGAYWMYEKRMNAKYKGWQTVKSSGGGEMMIDEGKSKSF